MSPTETTWLVSMRLVIASLRTGGLTFPEPQDTPARPAARRHEPEDEPVRIETACPRTDHLTLCQLLEIADRRPRPTGRPLLRLVTVEKRVVA